MTTPASLLSSLERLEDDQSSRRRNILIAQSSDDIADDRGTFNACACTGTCFSRSSNAPIHTYEYEPLDAILTIPVGYHIQYVHTQTFCDKRVIHR